MNRAALLLLLAVALLPAPMAIRGAAAAEAAAPSNAVLFCIGAHDGSAMEFGLAEQHWPAYAKHFPKPIVFTVGKSRPTDWPYIHPSTRDTWAGGQPHTFTVRYRAERAPAGPLFLTLGLVSIWEPSLITISVNGKEVASQRLPNAPVDVGSASDPRCDGDSLPLTFPVPAGALAAGENTIEIRLQDGSWIIYDYVSLGPDRAPPPFAAAPPPPELLQNFLAGPMAGVTDVVFAVRKVLGEHWYANFSYYAADGGQTPLGDGRKLYREGGKLCRLNVRTGKVTTLLDDSAGGVRDPQVHYDGQRILFSYRKGGTEHYHLYEIRADGSGLKELTGGPWDDFEPSYLPGGGIVFVSSRCKRWVNCWLTQVAVLHRCDEDGRNIREISANVEQDNTPWPLPDGRILYMRWEYVDRSQVHYHHLWSANPDGTGQTVFYGNLHPGIAMLDAKPIPGSDKVVVSFSPGHGRTEHEGAVTVVDPKAGPDDQASARRISKGEDFRDPWAFSEDCFLAARGASLVLMNGRGQTREIYQLPAAESRDNTWCHEPRPLRARPREAVIAPRTEPAQANGRMVLANVYEGRNMDGVKPGEIKKLLVLESLPKPVNFTGGMDPLSYGGTFTLERILGTVPVEADGSAFFEVPAVRAVFFVALDADDLAVKRMQSFATVEPGESVSCVGCHEARVRTPPSGREGGKLLATRREPSRIAPVAGAPDVFDFPRDVQPVLDALCVKCHGYDKTEAGGPRSGRIILSGDRGPMFSHSYYTMTIAALFSDGRNQPKRNYAPRTLGSSASRILARLDGTHHGVRATPEQKRTLRLWIDSGAPYPGTYAALGTGMIGGYAQNTLVETDTDWPTTKAGAQAIAARCSACHPGSAPLLPKSLSDERGVSFWQPQVGDPRLPTSRHLVFNLTRPEHSLLLLAPLAPEAGGWGLCRDPKTSAPAKVFADKSDPGYAALLAMCAAGRDRLEQIKRFDMPGFRPRVEYVREMIRYGVLPASFDPAKDPLDGYATDRAYWSSLWYRPPAP